MSDTARKSKVWWLVVGLCVAVGGTIGWRVQVWRYDHGMAVTKAANAANMARASADWGVPEKYQGRLALFVLAGQSNMSGRGEMAPKYETTDDRVYLFGNDGRWKLGREPTDNPVMQVDKVSEDWNAGVSPGMAFARSLLQRRGDLALGLIPCARGGTSLYEWRRALSDTTLYGSCLKRIRAASLMGRVEGLLWFQGEEDAVDPGQHPEKQPAGAAWDKGFAEFVANIRADLGRPDLPIVFAQIGTTTDPHHFCHWDLVKAAQARTRIPNGTMITSDDLALKDRVHFTSESYVRIGERFGAKFVELMGDRLAALSAATPSPSE